MEGNYSIEVVEMICAHDCDGNAQVTTAIPVEAEEVKEVNVIPNIDDDIYNGPQSEFRSFMGTNAATNWLLFGIMIMIFMFMIFKCD